MTRMLTHQLRSGTRFWKLAFWTLAALTMLMSLMPHDQVPRTLVFWDKAQHALGFAALALLGLLAYPAKLQSVVFGLLLWGVVIECAQALTGWRQGDWQDWLADAVGIGLGCLVMAGWSRAWRRAARAPRSTP